MRHTCIERLRPHRSARPAVEGVEYGGPLIWHKNRLTLSDFKLHARVDFNTDGNLLPFYLKSARQYLEQWSQLSFGVKTIRFTAFGSLTVKLMFGLIPSTIPTGLCSEPREIY